MRDISKKVGSKVFARLVETATSQSLFQPQDIYIPSDVYRWGTVPMTRQQNIAEHQWNVAMISMWLLRYSAENIQNPEFAHDGELDSVLLRTLVLALTHDLPEIWLGDPPSNAKEHYPALSAGYAKASADLSSKAGGCLDERKDISDLERWVVKLADCIDAHLYCRMHSNGCARGRAAISSTEARLHRKIDELPPSIRDWNLGNSAMYFVECFNERPSMTIDHPDHD